jgi:hypothetical protein
MKSAESAEECPEESRIMWIEEPEEPEIKWFQEPEKSEANADIKTAVKYLLGDAFEGAKKATGTRTDAGPTGRWRSGESFAEWQSRVKANAEKLADGFKKLADDLRPKRNQGGALKRWKRDQEEKWWRTVDSWRNRTPEEMLEARIRWNLKDAAAARACRANH